jgi:hypothetical protein
MVASNPTSNPNKRCAAALTFLVTLVVPHLSAVAAACIAEEAVLLHWFASDFERGRSHPATIDQCQAVVAMKNSDSPDCPVHWPTCPEKRQTRFHLFRQLGRQMEAFLVVVV